MIVALGKGVLTEIEALLTDLDLSYVSVNQGLALKAVELYQRYGKGGGHPAQLNYGDCFATAIATGHQMPLLYTGKNFGVAQKMNDLPKKGYLSMLQIVDQQLN